MSRISIQRRPTGDKRPCSHGIKDRKRNIFFLHSCPFRLNALEMHASLPSKASEGYRLKLKELQYVY